MGGFVHFSSAATPVTYSDFSSVITAITGQVSVNTIVAVLASAVGLAIGMVFMWWGVRKVAQVIMSAFRGGRVNI